MAQEPLLAQDACSEPGGIVVLAMPFETVQEHYVRERRVRVCERCRRPLPDVVENRGTYNTVGSIAGSVGTSAGGSMAGAALGTAVLPGVGTVVGSLAGAIGGAVVGSRAGAAASDGICDAVEANAAQLCDACKAGSNSSSRSGRPSATNWGGGRLGGGDAQEPLARGAGAQDSGRRFNFGGEGQRLGGGRPPAASASQPASGEEPSMWSRLSAMNPFAGNSQQQQSAAGRGTGTSGFAAFGGAGHVLGSGPSPAQADGRAARQSQLEEDEALARRLQQEEEMALQQERGQHRGF
uniref:Glycine zipper domain-containing protein n=1 Tax=Alexandrium monilatum TaxID=311494 RepID=A0A7S4S861_9DINO